MIAAMAVKDPGLIRSRRRGPGDSESAEVGTLNLDFRIGQSGLPLVFPAAVFVRDGAVLVGLEKEDLADALVDVNAKG